MNLSIRFLTMDTVTYYFRNVFTTVYFAFNWLKKLFRRNTYRDQESLLPITVNNASKSSTQFNYSSSSIVNTFNTNINQNWNLLNNRHPANGQQTKTDEQEEEINYFEDMNMKPSLTRQKKVYINQNANLETAKEQKPNGSNFQSDRLNFDSKNVYNQANELGFLDDHPEVGWENDIDADNTDLDENMKIMRQAEIERRIQEHKRIKMEKEFRKSKEKKSNFMATKIS